LPRFDRIRKAWNVFVGNKDQYELGLGTSEVYYGGISPSRPYFRYSNERSIIASIYARLSIDIAAVTYRHVRIDDLKRYKEDINSAFNGCLNFAPNLDQGPRAFRQDVALTLFDKGVAVIVPVDTIVNPATNETVDIYSMRVGHVVSWHPKHVKVSVYNEATGKREDVTLEKRFVAIIENPLYSVMNEPNSTLQRLIGKLSLLDAVDEQSGSGKLDLIIQLPYVIKSEARKEQAEKRREDIEFQLRGSKYGIAYTDGTEKITQLNRPAENNLLAQVEYLTAMLYSQLGLTEDVMNGTADEKSMLNYNARTVEPIVDAVMEAMQIAFIGPRRTENSERIQSFTDPFRFVPVASIAELADKFTRNEILTGNEIRGIIGFEPYPDPKADQLRNSNMPTQAPVPVPVPQTPNGNVPVA
jgi:hypothetical protein